MNDFKKLTLDDLVEIAGSSEEYFQENFVKDEEGYFHRKIYAKN